MFYIGIFLFVLSFAVFVLFWRKIALDHYFKISSKQLILQQQKVSSAPYFSSYALRKILKTLLRFPFKKNKKLLLNLACGKTSGVLKFLRQKKLFFEEASLKAFYQPEEAVALFKKIKSESARIELVSLLFELGKKDEASALLDTVQVKTCPPYFKAKAAYYQAQFALICGDMENASQQVAVAASLFKKSGAYIEEAYAYLLSATIFRVSAVEDVSHFMFRQAAQLFHAFGHPAGEADAFGGLGMLWTMRENFDDALAYFQKSLDINLNSNRLRAAAYILTQKALTLLLQKKYDDALCSVHAAVEAHEKLHDKNGLAFAHQVRAFIFCEQNLWSQALIEAVSSARIYQKGIDTAAALDSLYLIARIDFELERFAAAEAVLRLIIKKGEKDSGCFHIANAYSLLGLIFLQKNELARAKSLFLKSASIEQKDERFSGAATDYANIALIESKLGNSLQAIKTYETALTYATAFEETELADIIRKKIKSLEAEAK